VRSLFNEKAGGWSAKYGPGAALAWRVDAFVRAVQSQRPSPARLLDFGCGTGQLATAFATHGYAVTGADIAEEMLEEARLGGTAVEWRLVEPGARLPFEDQSFDAVVASSVLEYVADPGATLAEWARVLRPGGVLVFTVPNVRHPVRRVERALAWVARAPGAGRVASVSARAQRYLQYLRLSKNRRSREGWGALLGERGFLPSGPVDRQGTLDLLCFRRR
jgi:ubiquinone/menaquinone biosynthesis C-methylase UbiE